MILKAPTEPVIFIEEILKDSYSKIKVEKDLIFHTRSIQGSRDLMVDVSASRPTKL
jgi:hypothetical protein